MIETAPVGLEQILGRVDVEGEWAVEFQVGCAG
jgi:hypothetical protein